MTGLEENIKTIPDYIDQNQLIIISWSNRGIDFFFWNENRWEALNTKFWIYPGSIFLCNDPKLKIKYWQLFNQN